MKKAFLLFAGVGIITLSSFTKTNLIENVADDDYCSITKTWSVGGEITRSVTISGSPCSEVIEIVNSIQ